MTGLLVERRLAALELVLAALRRELAGDESAPVSRTLIEGLAATVAELQGDPFGLGLDEAVVEPERALNHRRVRRVWRGQPPARGVQRHALELWVANPGRLVTDAKQALHLWGDHPAGAPRRLRHYVDNLNAGMVDGVRLRAVQGPRRGYRLDVDGTPVPGLEHVQTGPFVDRARREARLLAVRGAAINAQYAAQRLEDALDGAWVLGRGAELLEWLVDVLVEELTRGGPPWLADGFAFDGDLVLLRRERRLLRAGAPVRTQPKELDRLVLAQSPPAEGRLLIATLGEIRSEVAELPGDVARANGRPDGALARIVDALIELVDVVAMSVGGEDR